MPISSMHRVSSSPVSGLTSWQGKSGGGSGDRENDGQARRQSTLVARRRPLPALRPVLAGHRRRRLRRPARRHQPPGPPGVAGGGRHLAVPDHALARRRLGLRRQRLPGRPSRLRHAGRPGRADRRGRGAGPAGPARPGAQPHQLAARVVHRRGRPAGTPRTADYYVWADPAPGGGPPNNWLDATGHGAWTLRRARAGSTTCTTSCPPSPTSTGGSPAVHEEFARDAAVLVRPRRRRVPHRRGPRPVQGRAAARQPAGAPEDRATRWSTTSGSSRSTTPTGRRCTACTGTGGRSPDSYAPERLLLGETWVRDPAQLAAFYGRGDELQLAFNFPFVFAGFSAAELAGVVRRTLAELPAGGCPVWMASNHDVGRFPSRWCGGDDQQTRLALLLLATLPGAVVLYYGDEIGMADVTVPPALARDEMTRATGRGRARTATGAGRRCSGTARRRPGSPRPRGAVAAGRRRGRPQRGRPARGPRLDPEPVPGPARPCAAPSSAASSPVTRSCPARPGCGCTRPAR